MLTYIAMASALMASGTVVNMDQTLLPLDGRWNYPHYLTFVGGFRDGWSRMRRDPGFNLLHEYDIRSEVGEEYSIVVTIQNGKLRYYINGKKIHDVHDPDPLSGGKFGIRTWSTNAWWDDVEIGQLK